MLFNKIPVGIAARDLAFNQDVKSIKPKNSLTSDFLLSWFSASENKLMNMVSGTGIGAGKLDTQDMMAMDLWIPSPAEQTKIANFLTAVDEKLAQITRKHELLTQYKKGVMQQIFSQELRFKDDDGREFGEWEERSLGDISEIKTGPFGSTLHQHDYVEAGTPIITVEHLGERGVVHQNLPLVSDADKTRLKSYELKQGDIVFSRVGSVDRSCLVRTTEDGWLFSGRLLRLRLRDNNFSAEFLNQNFKNDNVKYRIRSAAVGQTMASLNTEILKSFEMSFPTSLAEQTKIANFLTAIDDKITATRTQLAAVKKYKQGLLQQMFV